MKEFTADFYLPGSFSCRVASADAVDKLVAEMVKKGFDKSHLNVQRLMEFAESDEYRMSGQDYTIRRRPILMTEYTSP